MPRQESLPVPDGPERPWTGHAPERRQETVALRLLEDGRLSQADAALHLGLTPVEFLQLTLAALAFQNSPQ